MSNRAVHSHLALATIALGLAACTKEPPPRAPTESETSGTVDMPASSVPPATSAPESAHPGTPARPGSKEGEMCGGIAGLMCAEGLTCDMVGPPHPDQSGVCRKH